MLEGEKAALSSLVQEEPPDDEYETVYVKVRMPSGKEIRRRFLAIHLMSLTLKFVRLTLLSCLAE